jgi:sporulation protein YlmC with PRC-barrel domain
MATEEMTPTVEVMATEEMTPTVEVMATEEVTETETITDTETMTTTVTQAILASDLVGMDITNDDGEEVGEVGELLLEQDGTVQYVIFDVGGFLGIGEKSVAVTWDEVEIQLADDVEPPAAGDEISPDDFTVRYTGGAAADLEALPEFDTAILDEDGYVLGEDPDTEDDFDATPYTGLIQVGEFQDYNLMNTADEDIGEVEDLIIDLGEGQVVYAVVDIGGFLGIGENSVAIPWERLELDPTDEDETFVLDVTQADIEEAPVFDIDLWTYPVDPDWDTEDIRSFWDAS